MKVNKLLIFIYLFSFINLFYAEDKPKTNIEVALVYAVGGRGDKSFNDLSYDALEKAKKDLGITFQVATPAEGSDREMFLRKFAASNAKIIFGTGFMFSDDMDRIAKEFPDKFFACIDYSVKPDKEIPANLLGIKFRENESSFLVGAIAGMLTNTNKVGFVGGAKGPLIKKFEVGYTAGVKQVNPNCEVNVTYAGVSPDAFANPVKGKELAYSLYNNGADIIFQASGSTGLGVFKAADELKKMAIGVDTDQSHEAKPGTIISSATKQVDVVVYNTIKTVIDGKFKGGVIELGLKEGGVGYIYNESNKRIITENMHKKIEELKDKIIKGEIIVPFQ